MKQLFSMVGAGLRRVTLSAETSEHRLHKEVGKTDMYNAAMGRGQHGISSIRLVGVLMRRTGTLA